ncbi:unnamed protein product [Paramecium pentaurelia]|uniref:DNA topoisomerase I eukaryotic-type domain-containing protein n=1 Tax=Paramecium pentaurelia TaxID=43138 RepID=A0A8S1YMZ5_9CILI|nr:unnamed protein product [Paramecium pentaurelia]
MGDKKIKIDEYKEIRLGGFQARSHNWWEEANPEESEEEEQQGQEWRYLEHHGVLFPPFYKRHNVGLIYNGKLITLTEEQEELCTYWAQSIGSPYEFKEIYRKNFESLMQTKFEGFQLDNADFTKIKEYLEQQRLLRLNKSDEQKKQEKLERDQRELFYGYALVDGCLERVGNYTLEQPTLFKGRGEHPKAGLLKARIFPEELTVNLSTQAPVPQCKLPGHSWGKIVHRNDVTWLFSYVDSSIRKDNHKYVQFAATSRFKQMNDKRKYEKARRLKNCIDQIRENYTKKLQSDSIKERQLGTATYLIDKLALRVGNEKDEDEADTVGCCSLRVEHIKLKEDDVVAFDFLGKDSMRYNNEVKLAHQIWKNLKLFIKGKQPEDNLFSDISVDDLNDFLKKQMEGLTAKVFRTYNASFTLQQQLDLGGTLDGHSIQQKVDFYDNANKQVAILCNHQKTISKQFELTKKKINTKLECMKTYIQELEQHYKKKNPNEYEEEIQLEEGSQKKNSIFIKKFPGQHDKIKQMIQKTQEKYQKELKGLEKKEENKEIALGTSKTNYNDPRISVAFCKVHDVPIERVFSKTLRNKFIWAMATDSNWKF